MIGTELLLGQIQDTNSTYMSQLLAEHGIPLYQKVTVGDNQQRILAALDDALERSDVVLCSGGLGPTEDDITREAIAELLERKLIFRNDLYEDILSRFKHYRLQITENNKRQATLPEGAIPIENPNGTAPGLIIEDKRGVIVCMPGVPGELKPMLTERVIPYIKKRFKITGTVFSRILKVCGMGESRVDNIIGDLVQHSKNPTVGLLASPEAVTIRITAYAADRQAADQLIEPLDIEIRDRLRGLVMGVDEDTLEDVVDRLLLEQGWKLAVYETFTGGLMAQRFSAATTTSFLGALVRNPAHANGLQKAFDLKEQILLYYPAECILIMQTDLTDKIVNVNFFMPENSHKNHFTWSQPFGSFGIKDQMRMTVSILERIRRVLTNGQLEP